MKYITALLLLCASALACAAPQSEQASSSAQLEKLLFSDPDSPRAGSTTPRLTIVSFTDYNCPYCKQFDPMLEKVVRDNPDVQLIVKLLPFKGPSSVSAAKVALAAWQQSPEKFWALHQRLMAKRGFHDDASILAAQKTTGTGDLRVAESTPEALKMNLILSQVLNIQGTPATIIGDQMVAGAIPQDELEALVKEQLAKADAQ